MHGDQVRRSFALNKALNKALNEDWVATIVGLVLLVLVLTGVIPVGLVP